MKYPGQEIRKTLDEAFDKIAYANKIASIANQSGLETPELEFVQAKLDRITNDLCECFAKLPVKR